MIIESKKNHRQVATPAERFRYAKNRKPKQMNNNNNDNGICDVELRGESIAPHIQLFQRRRWHLSNRNQIEIKIKINTKIKIKIKVKIEIESQIKIKIKIEMKIEIESQIDNSLCTCGFLHALEHNRG